MNGISQNTNSNNSSGSVYLAAAKAIRNAKFLLVATGAGFSADSSLPTYDQIADVEAYKARELTYADICRPIFLEDEPGLFYGFWGQCFNDYRQKQPHEGYSIISDWLKRYFTAHEYTPLLNKKYAEVVQQRLQRQQSEEDNNNNNNNNNDSSTNSYHSQSLDALSIGALFCYTSNVDAHHPRTLRVPESDTGESRSYRGIFELHGNVENWQHSNWRESKCDWRTRVWHVTELQQQHKNDSFRFDVDPVTRLAGDTEANPWPRCPQCSNLLRPNVLMFGDCDWIENSIDEYSYVAWESAVESIIKSLPTNERTESDSDTQSSLTPPFVLLELGCGTRVPSVRMECEQVLQDTIGRSLLIRVNPVHDDLPEEPELHPYTLTVRDSALSFLRRVDSLLLQEQQNE